MSKTRRQFLQNVGQGMVAASLGTTLAMELDLTPALAGAAAGDASLEFGSLEPLVDLMQLTPPDQLLPLLVRKMQAGTTLREMIAAGSLANARSFGGEDYIGFHTVMAMSPSLTMSGHLSGYESALPVFKVLYRNSARLQDTGAGSDEKLKVVAPAADAGSVNAIALREAVRGKDMARAEAIFAGIAARSADDALNDLMLSVHDATEVHRTVLLWRSWAMLDIVGKERAHTMLRQSLHYCVVNESEGYAQGHGRVRTVIPGLLEQYKLLGDPLGTREADEAWVRATAEAIFGASADGAAELVAGYLRDGFSPAAISEALAVAANQLVLRDPGRPEKWSSPNKPAGSVHGDSVGVHCCDAVNAWCNIARVSRPKNAAASLMLAAYEIARDRAQAGRDLGEFKPRPLDEDVQKVTAKDPKALLDEADSAIRNGDQSHALATVKRYADLGHNAHDAFALLLKYAISEDGALHAEKFYQTVSEEYGKVRPAFRSDQLAALARVTASAHGYPAPGIAEARSLLKV